MQPFEIPNTDSNLQIRNARQISNHDILSLLLMEQDFWEIVLITLNECPMKFGRAFLLRGERPKAELKSEALIGKKKWYGVIETIHYISVIASLRSRRGNTCK